MGELIAKPLSRQPPSLDLPRCNVQQRPCTERGSRCLLSSGSPQVPRCLLSSGSPPGPPPLYCRGVFLTEAHLLDREGCLKEEALPPPPLGTCG